MNKYDRPLTPEEAARKRELQSCYNDNEETIASADSVSDFHTPAMRAVLSDEPIHLSLARQLIAARNKRDETAAAKATAEKEFNDAQAKLNEYMVEHMMEPFRCDGHSVGVSYASRVSVLAENREALADALRANGYGSLVRDELRIDDEQLERVQQIMLDLGVEGAVETTPTVHPSRLKAFVAELRRETDELPEWLAGLISVYDQPTIRLTKVATTK